MGVLSELGVFFGVIEKFCDVWMIGRFTSIVLCVFIVMKGCLNKVLEV
jgi:hypothetical protein